MLFRSFTAVASLAANTFRLFTFRESPALPPLRTGALLGFLRAVSEHKNVLSPSVCEVQRFHVHSSASSSSTRAGPPQLLRMAGSYQYDTTGQVRSGPRTRPRLPLTSPRRSAVVLLPPDGAPPHPPPLHLCDPVRRCGTRSFTSQGAVRRVEPQGGRGQAGWQLEGCIHLEVRPHPHSHAGWRHRLRRRADRRLPARTEMRCSLPDGSPLPSLSSGRGVSRARACSLIRSRSWAFLRCVLTLKGMHCAS